MSRNSKCSNSWVNHLERTRNPLILQKAWAKNPDKAIKFEFNLLNQECQTLEAAMALMVSSTTILEKALKIHKKNTKKARLLTQRPLTWRGLMAIKKGVKNKPILQASSIQNHWTLNLRRKEICWLKKLSEKAVSILGLNLRKDTDFKNNELNYRNS